MISVTVFFCLYKKVNYRLKLTVIYRNEFAMSKLGVTLVYYRKVLLLLCRMAK